MGKTLLGAAALCASICVYAQTNRIDGIRPDAPELAYFGEFDIGVRTLELTDANRADVLNTVEGGETRYYNRGLIVEVWYPAQLSNGQQPGGTYTSTTRNLNVIATLHGRAVRDADALRSAGAMPLVIISHGYPGNRYLISHLGENLASKGYVVASIDHRDSTYQDKMPIASTFYNRPLDQIFVLDEMAAISGRQDSFLSGLIDTSRTGIVGYSMGGFGLVNNLGGGFSEKLVSHEVAPANRLAFRHAAANPDYRNNRDPRIKAGFAIAPWGMAADVWNAEDLADIRVPTFYLAGSRDETSGYEDGVRAIFENATSSDRYLLTYMNAGHSVGAPIPLPVEILDTEDRDGASHYLDAVWDTLRMNNVMDHFATAFFDYQLKGDISRLEYLMLVPNANDGVYSMENDQATDAHTYWKGFERYSARGLLLEHRSPAE